MARSVDIGDITQTPFSDEKKFKEELKRILENLRDGIASIREPDIIPNEIRQMVDDKKVSIPRNYKRADGNNGTFDASSATIIPIQKVI